MKTNWIAGQILLVALALSGCARKLESSVQSPTNATSTSSSVGAVGLHKFLDGAEYQIPAPIGAAFWQSDYMSTSPATELSGGIARLTQKGFQTFKIPIDPKDADSFFQVKPTVDSFGRPVTDVTYLDALASSSEYRKAFGDPGLKTVVLTVYDAVTTGMDGNLLNFAKLDTLTSRRDDIIETYYELARDLFANYRDTGKTFILAAWELDNSMYCGSAYSFNIDPNFRANCLAGYPASYGAADPTEGYKNITIWFQLRQAGIRKAQAEARAKGYRNVWVYDGIEFNTVHLIHDITNPATGAPYPSGLWDVVPAVHPDAATYSAYESTNLGTLPQDWPTIEQLTRGSLIGISEFGFGEEQASHLTTTTEQILGLIGQGRMSFAIVWEAYYWTLQPQMGLLLDDGSNGPLFDALLAAFSSSGSSSSSYPSVTLSGATGPNGSFLLYKDIPTYTISKAPPNATVCWSSAIGEVSTGENNVCYGQTTDSSGFLQFQGGPFPVTGAWAKTAFFYVQGTETLIPNPASVSFTVVNTARTIYRSSISVTGGTGPGGAFILNTDTPTYTISQAPPNATVCWSSTIGGVSTGENNVCYGQTTDSSGFLQFQGGAFPTTGAWSKTAYFYTQDTKTEIPNPGSVTFSVITAPPLVSYASSSGADSTTGDIYITIYGANFGSGNTFTSNSGDGNSVLIACDRGTYAGMFSDTYDGAGTSGGEEQINTTVPPSAAGDTHCRATVIYGGVSSAPSAPFNLP